MPLDYRPRLPAGFIMTPINIKRCADGGRLTRYYTGRGDDGTTALLGAGRLKKSSPVIEAIGAIDELNSAVGVARTAVTDARLAASLLRIQNDLFILGYEIAAHASKRLPHSRISARSAARLEEEILRFGKGLPKLDKFVLPGGSVAAAWLHNARAVARRAERAVVAVYAGDTAQRNLIRYLNRLSSFLFVAALHANNLSGISESHPTY